MPTILLEACVDTVPDAIAAARAGADRIELCANLLEGGTTPSPGAMHAARQHLAIPVFALIRPRGGDFVHDAVEHEIMLADVAAARAAGLDGVAIGALTADHTLDVPRLCALVECARPLQVTCHRAFDETPDLAAALEQLIELGIERVLTSGGRANAREGTEMLRELVRRAGERIGILAAGSVRDDGVAALVRDTGVHEVHAGPRRPRPGARESWQVDEDAVARLRRVLDG